MSSIDKIFIKIKQIIPKKVFKSLQPAYHFCLSWLAALRYGWPSKKLIVIGVTGTTGKTTVTYLIAKMLESAGYKTGYTSTAMFSDGAKEWLNDKKMTMPGRFFTQKILRDMVKNNCRYAIVETTSEGIRQFRHRFINYDVLVFTGLYPEHIESHGSFENYKQAKGELFAHLKKCPHKYLDQDKKICYGLKGFKKVSLDKIKKTIIVNGDDEYADYFLDFVSDEKYQIHLTPPAGVPLLPHPSPLLNRRGGEFRGEEEAQGGIINFIADKVEVRSEGLSFEIEKNKINLQILGGFNVMNALLAVGVGRSQGLDWPVIKSGLESITGIPGRLERINAGQNFMVIVDYAFEPNAVAKLYETIKFIPHGKIIHVLGSCGGGRDVSRRPLLGNLAGQNADYVIVTDEDPYDDDPRLIIDQVAMGAENAGKKLDENLFKIMDRRLAIKKALSLAEVGDIVLITGKGSEQFICVAKGEKIAWDDREVVKQWLTLND
jgi:UDP-N-acetylmuramoyl-L-alanyl-D-glutamate--2,6-diaminopimelate ligase